MYVRGLKSDESRSKDIKSLIFIASADYSFKFDLQTVYNRASLRRKSYENKSINYWIGIIGYRKAFI